MMMIPDIDWLLILIPSQSMAHCVTHISENSFSGTSWRICIHCPCTNYPNLILVVVCPNILSPVFVLQFVGPTVSEHKLYGIVTPNFKFWLMWWLLWEFWPNLIKIRCTATEVLKLSSQCSFHKSAINQLPKYMYDSCSGAVGWQIGPSNSCNYCNYAIIALCKPAFMSHHDTFLCTFSF